MRHDNIDAEPEDIARILSVRSREADISLEYIVATKSIIRARQLARL